MTRISLSVVALLAVGLASAPASAFLFTENFSSHTVGGGIHGTNGWFSAHGSDDVPVNDNINNPVSGMVGKYGDMSPGAGSADGNMHANAAGVGGGLDPNGTYSLKWRSYALSGTSVEVGFKRAGASQGVRLQLDENFNGNSGRILFRGTEGDGDDTLPWHLIGDNDWADFELRIDQNRVELHIDGVHSGNRNMSAAAMQDIVGIHIWSDYSNFRNGGYIDNIVFTPEPGTLALLGVGGLLALRRRRA